MTATLVGRTSFPTGIDKKAAQKAAVEARGRNRDERLAFIQLVNDLAEGLTQEQTGTLALAATWQMGIQALSDEVSALDQARYAQAAETWHKIYRLATGQSTSNAAHASVDLSELADRKAVLLARLNGTADLPGV